MLSKAPALESIAGYGSHGIRHSPDPVAAGRKKALYGLKHSQAQQNSPA
jgi:hypothetical protein